MNRRDLAEAAALVGTIGTALLGTLHDYQGTVGADLRRAVGDLVANAETGLRTASIGSTLLACFDAARDAGATLDDMGRVRTAILGSSAASPAANAVRQGALVMCLVEEAQILGAMTFASRDEVGIFQARMNAAFVAAEDDAATSLDAASYRALIALHAAVTRDLTVRGRLLPRMISYDFAERKPSLWLENRIYADPSRAGDLIAENGVVHPAFMPGSGRALSA